MAFFNPALQATYRKQHTLKEEVTFSGIGVHTGKEVTMRFVPAKEGTGIIFRRVDLPSKPMIPAAIEYVRDTSRSTTLAVGSAYIHTVEHVLAALHAYQIDNLIIEVSNIEPPIGNGSSDLFVDMIERVGLCPQEAEIPIIEIQKPVFWADGDIQLVALPYQGYRLSYVLNYPSSNVLKSQFQSVMVTPEEFKKEIAPCRTFSLYEEVSMLMDRGLIKGGSLDNAVVILGDSVISKNGLFFSDEMCRHKILDMIGDLSLVGFRFHAHIIALRSGHASNYAFAQRLYQYITTENY